LTIYINGVGLERGVSFVKINASDSTWVGLVVWVAYGTSGFESGWMIGCGAPPVDAEQEVKIKMIGM
jgi:hypothetical protein